MNDPRLREVHVNTHHNSGPNVWRVMVRRPAPESFTLNALDEKYDGFIETGEREDLCREINEIVHAAGLRGCDGMADEWREW